MAIQIGTPVVVEGELMRLRRVEGGGTVLQRWRDGAWADDGGDWPPTLMQSSPATPEALREAGVPERDWIGTPHTV